MKNIVLFLFAITSIASAQYSLTAENIGGAKRAGENNLFRAQLKRDGSVIKTFERSIPFDVPFPATYVHPTTGVVVLSYIFDGFVEVYTAAGEKAWEQNFFKEMGPNYERTITVALGKSSIVFLTSDVTLPNAVVRKYSVNGAALWESALPYSMGYEAAMSDDDQTIAAGSYVYENGKVKHATTLLRHNGAVTGSADFLFRKAAFSPDGRMIGLISNDAAAVIDATDGKFIGKTNRKTAGVITDLIWDNDSLIVQESVLQIPPEEKFYYSAPTFITYSPALVEARRRVIPSPKFNRSTLHRAGNEIIFSNGISSAVISHQK